MFTVKNGLSRRDKGGLILGKRRHLIKTKSLSRMLVYVLGHRPDEFGLVPDERGYVPYKELLQALHEEDGWGYVRRSHINEVLLGEDRRLFECDEEGIRAVDRRWELDLHTPAPILPSILFTPVRRRAHPVVMERGLKAVQGRNLVLTPDKDMALRLGRRRDQSPVLLEIMAETAGYRGTRFFPFGQLFLSPGIPAKFIAGPPLPREVLERKKEKGKEKPVKDSAPSSPGTFVLDPSRDPDRYRKAKGKKRKGWKEAAKKMRKRKRP